MKGLGNTIKNQEQLGPEPLAAEFHFFENLGELDLAEHEISFRQGLIASKIAQIFPEHKISLTSKIITARKGKVILYKIFSQSALQSSDIKKLLAALGQ